MYRTNTCGELNLTYLDKNIVLSGWVHRIRKMGGMTFIDIRDRYGVTQLSFDHEVSEELYNQANKLGREWVIKVEGVVKKFRSEERRVGKRV